MTDSVRQAAALSPSPRHMRKRSFGRDVPTGHVAPKAPTKPPNGEQKDTVTVRPPRDSQLTAGQGGDELQRAKSHAKATPRRKRLIALTAVILVSLSIPLMVLTLIFAG